MTDILLTALIPLLMAAVVLWRVRIAPPDNPEVMDKASSQTLKGLCAIVVVMVHILPEYENPLQNAIGSFAYVAVTFFFLFSAYGMQWSLANKPEYLRHFWRLRLVALLLPPVLVNITFFLLQSAYLESWQPATLFYANNYVVILLEYCLLFYVVMMVCRKRHIQNLRPAMLLMAIVVAASSVLLYLLTESADGRNGSDWCFERYGLIWGLGLFAFFPAIKRWAGRRTTAKLIASAAVSGCLGIIYVGGGKEVFFWGEYALKIALGLAIVSTVLLLTRQLHIGNRATAFLGSISYEIYLSHVWMMQLIAHFLPDLSSGVFIIVLYCATIALSALIHQAVKAIRPRLLKA